MDDVEWAREVEDALGMSQEWQVRMARIREDVAGWRPLLLVPPAVVDRSPLAGDDKAFPPMRCSQLAWWGISVAVEHLDATIRALDQQVSVGGPILPSANFTVLRAALVGASYAVVLLGSTSRADRTTHGLQMAHEEYRQALTQLDLAPEADAYVLALPAALPVCYATLLTVIDALLAFDGPIIECHMSNIWKREPFRHHSFISKAATGVIAGLGVRGYLLGLTAMHELMTGDAA